MESDESFRDDIDVSCSNLFLRFGFFMKFCLLNPLIGSVVFFSG
jgi:hypothetical protein